MAEMLHLTYKTNDDLPADGKRKVFISYRKKDNNKKKDNKSAGIRDIVVNKILSMADVAIWFDEYLTPGVEYEDEIKKAISECDAMVLLLTRNILDSEFVWDKEVATAHEQKKPIIPIAVGISEKDIEKAGDKLGKVQILRWQEQEDDEDTLKPTSFDETFKRALDLFILNTDLAMRVENFFATGKHKVASVDLTDREKYYEGIGYLHGTDETQADEELGAEILDAVAYVYGRDEETKKLRGEAALELYDYYFDNRDNKKAFKYAELGAGQNNARSMLELGKMYYYGKGVVKDQKKAVEYYKRASEQVSEERVLGEAMYRLGVAYNLGKGVEKDYVKAAEWYNSAHEKKNIPATRKLADMHKNGHGVESNIKTAIELYEKAANAGDVSAMNALGKIYYKQEEYDKAFALLTKVVEIDAKIESLLALGDIYAGGLGSIPRDIDKACELYTMARKLGSKSVGKKLEPIEKEIEERKAAERAAEESAPAAQNESPDRTKSPARWIIPLAVLLVLAATAAYVQLSGVFDILGWLGSLLGL